MRRPGPRRGPGPKRLRHRVRALAIGTAGWALAPGDRPSERGSTPAAASTPPTVAPAASAAPLTPIDGRLTATIALELLGRQVPAAVVGDSIRGQGGVDLVDDAGQVVLTAAQDPDTYADFRVRNDRGESTVGVNVQGGAGQGLPLDCTFDLQVRDCRVETLPGGDLLRTYVDDVDKPGQTRQIAELISTARDLRVIVAATSASGATPAVEVADLRAVASAPVWGLQVPKSYVDKGDALSSYRWIHGVPSGRSIDRLPPTEPAAD